MNWQLQLTCGTKTLPDLEHIGTGYHGSLHGALIVPKGPLRDANISSAFVCATCPTELGGLSRPTGGKHRAEPLPNLEMNWFIARWELPLVRQ